MAEGDGSIRRKSENGSNGTPYHLVEIYAHNAIHEMLLKVRQEVRKERGKYTLPSSFLDRLEVECGTWILEKGAAGAERLSRGRIIDFLDERKRFKREEDERKVRARMPPE